MTVQQIVVHAGFHKTGTSAVQSFLHNNGKHLWSHMALVLPGRIGDVTRCATLHSVMNDPLSLEEFQYRLTTFLQTLDIGKKRHLLLSAEDLAGLIPGRSGHADYSACPVLMASIKHAIQEVFGTERALTFYFSTREKLSWLRSSYWQNLRGSDLRLDFDAFAATFDRAADFDPILQATQHALGDTPVLRCALEDTHGSTFGPATPLINLFPLPADVVAALAPAQHLNVSPRQALIDEIRDVNQSGLDREALVARKNEILALHSLPNSG